jgi:hypothetical protein
MQQLDDFLKHTTLYHYEHTIAPLVEWHQSANMVSLIGCYGGVMFLLLISMYCVRRLSSMQHQLNVIKAECERLTKLCNKMINGTGGGGADATPLKSIDSPESPVTSPTGLYMKNGNFEIKC